MDSYLISAIAAFPWEKERDALVQLALNNKADCPLFAEKMKDQAVCIDSLLKRLTVVVKAINNNIDADVLDEFCKQ